jgi:hypothetical protein
MWAITGESNLVETSENSVRVSLRFEIKFGSLYRGRYSIGSVCLRTHAGEALVFFIQIMGNDLRKA